MFCCGGLVWERAGSLVWWRIESIIERGIASMFEPFGYSDLSDGLWRLYSGISDGLVATVFATKTCGRHGVICGVLFWFVALWAVAWCGHVEEGKRGKMEARQNKPEIGQALVVLVLAVLMPLLLVAMFGSMGRFMQFYSDGGLFMHPIVGGYGLSVAVMVGVSWLGLHSGGSGRMVVFVFLVGGVAAMSAFGWIGTEAGFLETSKALEMASWDQKHRLASQYVSLSMYTSMFGGFLGGGLCLVAGVWACLVGWRGGQLDSMGMALGGLIALGSLGGAYAVVGGSVGAALSVMPWGFWLMFVGALGVGVLALGYKGKIEEGEEGDVVGGWLWGAWLGALGVPMLLGFAMVWVHLSEVLKALDRATADQKEALCRNYANLAGQNFLVSLVIVGGVLLLGMGMLALRGGALKGRGGFVLCGAVMVALFVILSQRAEEGARKILTQAGEVSAALRVPAGLGMLSDPKAPEMGSLKPDLMRVAADGKRTMVRLPSSKRKEVLEAKGSKNTVLNSAILQTDRRATLAAILGALRPWVVEQIKKQPAFQDRSGILGLLIKPSSKDRAGSARHNNRRSVRGKKEVPRRRGIYVSWLVKREDSRFSMADIPKYPVILSDILKPLTWPEIGAYGLLLSTHAETERSSEEKHPLLLTLRVQPNGVTITTRGKAIGVGCDLKEESQTFPTCGRRDGGWDQACLRGCLGKIKAVFPDERKIRVHVAQADALEVSLLSVFDALRSMEQKKGSGQEWMFPEIAWVMDETLAMPTPTAVPPQPVDETKPPIGEHRTDAGAVIAPRRGGAGVLCRCLWEGCKKLGGSAAVTCE